MRWLLSRRIPAVERVLLVESGSRHIAARVLAAIRRTQGESMPVDLVTCYPDLPSGFPADTEVFRVSDYPGRTGRSRLYRQLRARGYSTLGIICSGEPIMTKWKWALAVRVPAKVFVINDNADYFWLDRAHLGMMRRMAAARLGLSGSGAARGLGQAAAFPFVLAYLLLYAAAVHLRRALRL